MNSINYNVEVRDARHPFFGVSVTVNNKSTEYRLFGQFRQLATKAGFAI
ncbi:MAG: hypothetical protein ABL933_09355 [Methyloglobulus sp.]